MEQLNKSVKEFDKLPFIQFVHELNLVKENPRALLLVASGILELFVETVVTKRCKLGKRISNDSRTYTYAVKLVLLHEVGIIDAQEYEILEWLRKLRNRGAGQGGMRDGKFDSGEGRVASWHSARFSFPSHFLDALLAP